MESTSPSRVRALWDSRVGAMGLIAGLLPHLLHHLGFFLGTALIAGSGGKAVFGAVGLLLSIPMLMRLRKRFGSWKAPAIALVIFAAMFTVSTLVIGPMMVSHH